MRTLRVADLEAKPGEKVSGFVHIIGAEFGIPVTLICGEKEGETVLISGGVHNACLLYTSIHRNSGENFVVLIFP